MRGRNKGRMRGIKQEPLKKQGIARADRKSAGWLGSSLAGGMNKPKVNRQGVGVWKRVEPVEWRVDAPVRLEVRRHTQYDDWLRFGKPRRLEDKLLIILASGSIPT